MFYIVGLGNPGEKYEKTRHNVGRIIVQNLAKSFDFSSWTKSKGANAFYTKGELYGADVELLLPETHMNNSGESILYLKQKHNVKPQDILILYDDVDLPLGMMKVSVGKGAGGHNGIASIINALGSKDFIRIRIGISPTSFWTGKTKRPTGEYMAKYVLGGFNKKEMDKVNEVTESAYDALKTILQNGVGLAMNKYN